MMMGKSQFELQKLFGSYVSILCCGMNASNSLMLDVFMSIYNVYFHLILQRTNILYTMDRPSRSLLREIENLEVCFFYFSFKLEDHCMYEWS